jgi:hypothetical protein
MLGMLFGALAEGMLFRELAEVVGGWLCYSDMTGNRSELELDYFGRFVVKKQRVE